MNLDIDGDLEAAPSGKNVNVNFGPTNRMNNTITIRTLYTPIIFFIILIVVFIFLCQQIISNWSDLDYIDWAMHLFGMITVIIFSRVALYGIVHKEKTFNNKVISIKFLIGDWIDL